MCNSVRDQVIVNYHFALSEFVYLFAFLSKVKRGEVGQLINRLCIFKSGRDIQKFQLPTIYYDEPQDQYRSWHC